MNNTYLDEHWRPTMAMMMMRYILESRHLIQLSRRIRMFDFNISVGGSNIAQMLLQTPIWQTSLSQLNANFIYSPFNFDDCDYTRQHKGNFTTLLFNCTVVTHPHWLLFFRLCCVSLVQTKVDIPYAICPLAQMKGNLTTATGSWIKQ